ncbi:hypothetical protein GCM10023194_37590 [Planotetraspora phitsanulokensis]|uniref:Uncharacterized protein n=1 Tax=Planotetraspora phitsanulokensis TaxID=575192 RepID=A0A8J3UF99_9ACTN|nr:hypothetical protein Pph01_62820 [Planotetraspora phitsanulokensis]
MARYRATNKGHIEGTRQEPGRAVRLVDVDRRRHASGRDVQVAFEVARVVPPPPAHRAEGLAPGMGAAASDS